MLKTFLAFLLYFFLYKMGKGMSSKASRRFISKKGKLRGTHFHSILAIVCARRPVPASMLKVKKRVAPF